MEHSPLLGATLGDYEVLEKIAQGGMSTVYKARHKQSQQFVALKVVAPAVAGNPVLLQRFEQEFRITSKLDHPNIVRALEYSNSASAPFLVMELIEGESVGNRLAREGRIPEHEALRIVVQVAHGLHRAHRQGLIHRDVKPDNILVATDGAAKVTDLGLAKDLDVDLEMTFTGSGLGTPHFMAPEQFRDAKSADIRCDVYSLAATLYHMVTGEVPFGKGLPVQLLKRKLFNELPSPRQLMPSLAERVDWAIRRGLSADPAQRPASCREFVEDLLGQSTRPGLRLEKGDTPDTWYLVFRDADGVVRTAKGSTKAMRRLLQEGLPGGLGLVRASRRTAGPFELLHAFPEFRDLVVQPAPGPPLSDASSANLSRRILGDSAGSQTVAVPLRPPAEDVPTVPMIQLTPPLDDSRPQVPERKSGDNQDKLIRPDTT